MSYSEETQFYPELGWCPECQSPPSHDYSHVRYCDFHAPVADGMSDRLADSNNEYIARGEAGGESNAAVCNFIHRKGD